MTRRQPHEFRAQLATGRWFASLPDAVSEKLLAHATVRTVPSGGHVFSRGGPACGLYAVVDGAVHVTGDTESGKAVLYLVMEPPSWFGEESAFDCQPRILDAVAEGDATLLHVPQAALEQVLDEEPVGWRHLGQLVVQRLRLAGLAIQDIATDPALVRLARRLALIAEGYGDHTHRHRTVELGQEQFAAMLGVSRQTVNGLLKDLEARGLIRIAYAEIEIVDDAGLRALANLP